MDTNAFDNLARGVGRSQASSRRAALGAAGGALLGAALGSSAADAKKGRKKNRRKNKKQGPGSGRTVNLCCKYTCNVGQNQEVKRYCIAGAIEGTTRCDQGFEGCSFDDATFVDSCDACA
ncbi:MAG: hypothetical protein R2853_13325 [Thermomicrobiales bacterium]|nr:hypothetical protein [Thermomicrobiales bacterium]